MKNKKGFTLVEVLAVIAILMILVTLSVPRIRTIYDKAKENAFLTEFKSLERQITNKEVMAKMNKKKIVAISSEDETSLELSNKDFKYCIDLNKNGTFSRMQASDGKNYIEANRGDDIHSFTSKNITKGGYDKLRCVFDENRSLKNVILADNKAYPDNKKSTTVESENGIDFSRPASATNGIGLFYNYNSDDINKDGKVDKTYYFRGPVAYNNVIFANLCWKVVKIAEDGAVKLIYNGEHYHGQCYRDGIGGINYSYYNDSVDYANDKDSNVKSIIDDWYKNNLLKYKDYIQDTSYCNDRSKDEKGVYNSRNRLNGSVKTPTNKCSNEDSFTVSDKIGNGLLKYPVALLTGDEYIYSGGVTTRINDSLGLESNQNNIIKTEVYDNDSLSNTYLSSYIDYSTMTPSNNYKKYDEEVYEIYIVNRYGLYSEYIGADVADIPVIALNSKSIVKYGNGSSSNPYVIRIDTSVSDSKNCATNIYKKGTILNKMLSNNCAYPSNKKSEYVIKPTGIDFEYRSTVVPYKYYIASYNTTRTIVGEVTFYEKLDFNEETGEFSLSGKNIKGFWNSDSICSSTSCPVSGYYYEKNGDYSKVSSFYNSTTANVKHYYALSNYSELNGFGLYYTEDNEISENGKRIYFYRGDVNNNYAVLGKYCFNIIRTDENDNVRLIYYGDYKNGKCNRKSGIESENSSYSYGVYDNTYVGYMTGDMVQKEVKRDLNIYPDEKNYYFSSDYEYNNETKKYKLKGNIINGKWNTDTICTSSSCPVKNYYTCFAISKDKECEKINKINEFGTTSKTSSGNISHYVSKVSEIKYQSESYEKSVSNKHDSKIKKALDKWYETNIKPTGIKLADTVFCNDRSIVNANTGYGDISTNYSAYKGGKPTYICKQNNDKFTISTSNGNGKLKYPIALPTYDELEIMDFNSFATMTPAYYMDKIHLKGGGGFNPVIAVPGSTYVSQGNGRIDDPYLIGGGK